MSAGGKNGLTRLIESYADLEEIWKERNERHTKLVEQAGKDRSLFQDSRPSQTIPIMMLECVDPEQPNTLMRRQRLMLWANLGTLTMVAPSTTRPDAPVETSVSSSASSPGRPHRCFCWL